MMTKERINLSTREFMQMLGMNRTEFFEHKAIAGDSFPKPRGRGKNGFLWPFDDCYAYASQLLKAREDLLLEARQRLAEWVNPEA